MRKTKNSKNGEKQIDFELPSSRKEVFYKLKRKISSVEKKFTAIPFWQNWVIWINIASVIGISLITFLLILRHFSDLTPKVPMIFDTYNEKYHIISKAYLFLIPVVLVIGGFINVKLLQRTYYMNKRLVLMMGIISTLAYVLSLIAVNQILILSLS